MGACAGPLDLEGGPGLDGWCGIPWDRIGAEARESEPDDRPHVVIDADAVERDQLVTLGDRIATLAANIHAATHRLLVMLREFDRRGGWKAGGHKSCADWLAFRTGITKGAARERVRAARALGSLPETSAAMARGELSFAKVRAITRVAEPDTESDLVEFAKATTAAGVERMVRSWKRRNRMDEAEFERALHRSRTFSVAPDEEGMYVVRGRLDAEVGALLMKAIEAASDVLYREARSAETTRTRKDRLKERVLRELGGPGHAETTPAQRRADAVGLLAERVLCVGFGLSTEADGSKSGAELNDAHEDPDRDAEGDESPGRITAPISGTRAERYQVVLHVDADTLSEEREPGRSELADGTRVSAETSRRLACDASVIWMKRAPDGAVLGVGRRTRTVPPATRRALEARDVGCRFPGCGSAFTDAHHIRHWADGGETRLENLILLCRRHHRMLHEEGFRVGLEPRRRLGRPVEERAVFLDPRGMPVPSLPPRIRLTGFETAGTDALEWENERSSGQTPDWSTAGPRYRREKDVPAELEERAREAILGSGRSANGAVN